MRPSFMFGFTAALLLLGCKSAEKKETNKPAPTNSAEINLPGGKPIVRPVEAINGRILAVNPALRFVIVDFPSQRMPRLDQTLSVYRADLKVAEVRVSGPFRGTTVAADVTAGEARMGDLVREER